uniref:Hydrophobic protein LTI6B n=1 Tax=Triticum urartu TaxID=4572 RepID=A0A8R7JWE1_TRIUA
MAGTANCIDIILAIILPPLGVFLKFGCGHEFWICLLLTFLGYIPGIIYAIYAITKSLGSLILPRRTRRPMDVACSAACS